jgi:hypothetical protein
MNRCGESPANFGVKLSAGWSPARQPSCLLSCPASRRPAGRRSLPPSNSLVTAAVAPRPSLQVKPAAAYTRDVSPTYNLSMPAAQGIVGIFDYMSISIALDGGRMSLAHVMEFSHFVDLYLLEDRVYLDDSLRRIGLGEKDKAGEFRSWFDDDPSSPLTSLPEDELSNAVYNLSIATSGLYNYAPRRRYTFDLDSYKYWLTPSDTPRPDSERVHHWSDAERLAAESFDLDRNIEIALEELANTRLTLMPSTRNLLPFLHKFHQIDTPALALYRSLSTVHREKLEGVLALTRPRTVYLPPLLTVLLSRCEKREDIRRRLIELRDELADFRSAVAEWLARMDAAWSVKEKAAIRAELDACLQAACQQFGGQRRGVYKELLGAVVDGAEDGNPVKVFTKPAAVAIKQLLTATGPEALAARRVTGLVDLLEQSLDVFENSVLLRRVFGDTLDISQFEITEAKRYQAELARRYGVGETLPS